MRTIPYYSFKVLNTICEHSLHIEANSRTLAAADCEIWEHILRRILSCFESLVGSRSNPENMRMQVTWGSSWFDCLLLSIRTPEGTNQKCCSVICEKDSIEIRWISQRSQCASYQWINFRVKVSIDNVSDSHKGQTVSLWRRVGGWCHSSAHESTMDTGTRMIQQQKSTRLCSQFC